MTPPMTKDKTTLPSDEQAQGRLYPADPSLTMSNAELLEELRRTPVTTDPQPDPVLGVMEALGNNIPQNVRS